MATRVYKVPNFNWGNRIVSGANSANGPPNVGLNNLRQHPTLDLSVSFTKVADRHTFKTGLLQQSQPQAGVGQRVRHQLRDHQLRQRHRQPVRHVVRVRQRGDRQLHRVPAGRDRTSRAATPSTTGVLLQDNWKVNEQADARLRRPLRPRHAAVRQPDPGRQLPARTVLALGRRRRSTCYGCANGVYPCTGNESPGDESADRPVPGTEHHRGRRHAGAGYRQPRTACSRRARDRRDELHLPGTQRRAALRHGLRRDRDAALRRARRHRHLLRPPASGRRAGARGQHRRRRSACATRSCRTSAPAG